MNNKSNSTDEEISKFFNDPERVTKALQAGIDAALLRHKKMGNPICVSCDGKIIWIDKQAYINNYSKKQEIYTALIKNAKLTDTGLSFSIPSSTGNWQYDVKLMAVKETNLQGVMKCFAGGEWYQYPLHLQIFKNRLGLILEGEWNEGGNTEYYSVIHLYYTL